MLYKPFILDCYDQIKDLSLTYLGEHWDFKKESIIRIPTNTLIYKLLNNEFTIKKLPPILGCSIFARGARNIQTIHYDCMPDGEKCHSGIIIPIVGSENSKFQWFDESMKVVKLLTPDKKSYFYKAIFETQPIPTCELEVIHPIIAKIDVPHRAISSNTSARAILSIKFVGNPILL